MCVLVMCTRYTIKQLVYFYPESSHELPSDLTVVSLNIHSYGEVLTGVIEGESELELSVAEAVELDEVPDAEEVAVDWALDESTEPEDVDVADVLGSTVLTVEAPLGSKTSTSKPWSEAVGIAAESVEVPVELAEVDEADETADELVEVDASEETPEEVEPVEVDNAECEAEEALD